MKKTPLTVQQVEELLLESMNTDKVSIAQGLELVSETRIVYSFCKTFDVQFFRLNEVEEHLTCKNCGSEFSFLQGGIFT